MWRSWVDKINTINKPPEGTVRDDTPQKREQQLGRIRDVWSRSNDLLSSADERSSTFVIELLPLIYEYYEQFDIHSTLSIIPDERTFVSSLTKELIGGIRKLPENKDKTQSSEALIDILRSKSHLYNVIRTIKVLTHGNDNIVSIMLQQRIPFIMVKLFRSFLDLSTQYYGSNDKPELVSLTETGDVITDILKQFVQNQFVLHRLIMEDTFFTIIRILFTRPTNAKHEEDAEYMIWKYRTVDILKTVDVTGEIVQYLHNHKCVEFIVKSWQSDIVKAQLTVISYREIILSLDLIYYLLRGSSKVQSFGLFEEMETASGYDTLWKILRMKTHKEEHIGSKREIVRKLVDLAFIGKIVPIPSITEGLPYQHEDFAIPQPKGRTDKIVKNTKAFQCLLACFLYPIPQSSSSADIIQSPNGLPRELQIEFFFAMKQIIEAHLCNYFIIECTNAVAQFIEGMEIYDSTIQKGILDTLTYIMTDLNFVPLKELAVLSLHLQNSSSGNMIPLICAYLIELLHSSPKFHVVIQEAGLINIISLILSDITERLISGGIKDHNEFFEKALENFDIIIQCIIAMTQTTENVIVFRRTYRGNLLDLLQYKQTRLGALRLFESLSSHSSDLKTAPGSPTSDSSSSSSELGNAFSKVMEAVQVVPRDDLDFRLEVLRAIKRIFAAHKTTKDTFRKVGGYISIVSMIVTLEGSFQDYKRYIHDPVVDTEEAIKNKLIATIKMVFSVLAQSMHNHQVNKLHFRHDVGYESLENAIKLTGIFENEETSRKMFGILFGFAVEDNLVADIFVIPKESKNNSTTVTMDLIRRIEMTLKSTCVAVVNPEIMPSIFHLQLFISNLYNQLSHSVLIAILALAQGSRRNQVKMNSSGLILTMLERVFPRSAYSTQELALSKTEEGSDSDIIFQVIKTLMSMGLNYKELRYIFKTFDIGGGAKLEDSGLPVLMDLIVHVASRSRFPNFIQFDMGNSPTASLEIPRLHNFPPSSPGYSLLMWLHIEERDDQSNLQLFSIWNDKQLVMRFTIDAQTQTLHVYNIQTKQTFIFSSFEFHLGYWYHLSIVHHKARMSTKSSTLTMYVNGSRVEQLTCPYLSPPPANIPYRAVIGTLNDHHLLDDNSQLIWDLGPSYLIMDTLEPELINLYFNLGARYKSLFQGSLKDFLTYEALTSLSLKFYSIQKSTPGKKEPAQHQTLLDNLLTEHAMQNITESKILFAFFACNSLAEGNRTGLTLTGLSESTSLTINAEVDSSRLVLNSAIPKLDFAVYKPKNMGFLVGQPIVAYPFGLDESIWKIGGCAIALKLIERAESHVALCKASAILFEIIRYSWRNSKDMERIHGYDIFAYLLKQKRELITVDLLNLILVFIGKNSEHPNESVINNPVVYRDVILNFGLWKNTSHDVQKLHLDQFILFLNTSKMREFNIKQISRYHIVRKMVFAFRMNIYTKELTSHVVTALKAVMMSNWNIDSIKVVSSFIASTVSKEPALQSADRTLKRSDSAHSMKTSKRAVDPEGNLNNEMIIDAREFSHTTKIISMRNIVLEMLHDILCDKHIGIECITKFADNITHKWALLFFAPKMNPFTVVLAARILGRLLITQGPTYINKFRTQSEGFIVLQTLLPAYWNLLQLHEALLAMMMGIDIAYYPLYPTFDINHLRTCLQNSKQTRMAIPDLLPVITSLWNEGRKVADVPILSAYPPSMRTSRNRSNSAVVYPIKGHKKKEDSLSARIQISKSLDEFIRLFKDLYNARPDFREACNKQDIYDCLLKILFPSICPSAIPLTIEDELCSKDAVLSNFEMEQAPSIVSSPMDTIINDRIGDDTSSIDSASTPGFNSIIKRGGASTRMTKTSPHVSKRGTASMTRLRSASWSQAPNLTDMKMIHSSMLNSLVDFIVDVCINSILDPNNKNLTNLTLVMSAFPPSGHDQQLLFESYLLTHIAQKLKGIIQLEMEILYDHKILINMTKFCQMAADAVIQGRFREGGAEQTYDLSVTLLELLHNDEFTSDYSNYDASIGLLYKSFNRMILVKISDLEHGDLDIVKIVAFLDYCIHHQKIILSVKNTDIEFLKCFCYHLYRYLLSSDEGIKNTAANIWKLLILQKADIITSIFKVRVKGMESEELIGGFTQMLEMDMESFYRWLDSRKVELNILFNEHICKAWENVILQEQKYSRETLRNYVTRRINKLKRLQRKEIYEQDVILDYTSKSLSWSSTIHEQEIGLFTKVLQDNDTHDNSIRGEWSNISDDLLREKAIWGPEQAQNLKWGLDNTEGPNRMRKRLKCLSSMHSVSYLPKHGSAASSNTRTTPSTAELKRRSVNLDKELKNGPKFSFKENENKAIPESNDSKNAENNDLDEDDELSYEEDKNLKVTRLLERGDFVHDVYNVSQISGLDACEGLLILCQNNIYLIDNFFQQADGDIAEIWDVPKEERDQYLLLIAQAAGMDTETFNKGSGELHRCRKWATADLRDVFKRRFLFRDVALEIFFTDGRNALITVSLSERDEVYSKLVSRVSTHDESSDTIFGGDKDNYTSGLSSTFRLSSIFGTSTLHELTQRWERHDISNFQYLMYLNAIAGRSYNDITQYPVFPWILADYKSEELDLDDPFTFRDLTRPMGAQTSERRIEFADRYRQWKETDDPAPAFHYGTHYSSAMIVCSFLIRLEPFTQNYLKLQGGTFDHADRLFDSVGKAWDSASEKNMGDVRELIPEFFYLPEFLTNVNKFNFGIKQGTGEAIDSVVLPPWAHGDPKIFIQKHREALESDHVSRNLHHWIDLIFGYKQQGPAAIDSLNVFHHISYEGAVDLDSITDIVEKTATIGIINNFGQTPRQLFKKPHPSRLATPKDPMVLGAYKFEDYLDLLTQSRVPIRDIKQQVGTIDLYNDKLGVTVCQQLLMPPDGSRYIEWGFTDSSLRVFSTDTGKLLNVFESMHVGYISKAYFSDNRTLITGGTDSLICIWKLKNDKNIEFSLMECLRGHTGTITAIAASSTYSILVTGSDDKTAIVWDLNRMKYIRSLSGHENKVQLISINDTTGDIITCSGHVIRIWSINGDLYLTKSTCPSSESILASVFYEKSTEWSSEDLLLTGHKKGFVKFWKKRLEKDTKTGKTKWTLALVYEMRHQNPIDRQPFWSDIVALKFSNSRRTLFTGNRHGQVYSFVLPDCSDPYHLLREDRHKECMACRKAFSVLERKTHCRACGAIFCSNCISNLTFSCPDKSAKFCKLCFDNLSQKCDKV